MAVTDFWLEQVVDFVRKLRSQCDRCTSCGALACGAKHDNWHTAVNTKLDNASTAIQNLRNRMTTAETAITDLQTRMTAAENRLTSLEARVTALGG